MVIVYFTESIKSELTLLANPFITKTTGQFDLWFYFLGMIKNDLYNGYTSLSKNMDFITKITSIDSIISTLISNIYPKIN